MIAAGNPGSMLMTQRDGGGREETVGAETPLSSSSWGRRVVGKTRAPMTGKNIWRLCKVYGRIIGYPELKPHDPARCRDGGSRTRSRAGTRATRASADRHHADLYQH